MANALNFHNIGPQMWAVMGRAWLDVKVERPAIKLQKQRRKVTEKHGINKRVC